MDDPNLFGSSAKKGKKNQVPEVSEDYEHQEVGEATKRKPSISSQEFIDTIYNRMVKQTLKTKEKIDKMRVEKIQESKRLQKALPATPGNRRRSHDFLNRMSDHVRQITDLSSQMEVDKLKREQERKREMQEMAECTFQPKINQNSDKIGSRKNSFGQSTDLVDRLHGGAC